MVLAQRKKYRSKNKKKEKKRNIDQWNKTEIPEKNPHIYGHLVFDQGGKNIQWRKDNLSNKWCSENWSTTCKRMKLEESTCLTSDYTTNLQSSRQYGTGTQTEI